MAANVSLQWPSAKTPHVHPGGAFGGGSRFRRVPNLDLEPARPRLCPSKAPGGSLGQFIDRRSDRVGSVWCRDGRYRQQDG